MSLDEEIYELIAHEGNPPVDSAPEVRRALSAAIAKLTQENIPSSRATSRHIESLNDEGLVQFEAPLLSTTQVEEVREFLLQEPVFNAHVPAQSDGKKRYLQPKNLLDRLRANPRKYPFASYSLSSVVACPHLLEAVARDAYPALARLEEPGEDRPLHVRPRGLHRGERLRLQKLKFTGLTHNFQVDPAV